MNLEIQQLLLLLLLSSHRGSSDVIYTSYDGFDNPQCGSNKSPCHSVDFPLHNVVKSNDVLYINGCDKNRSFYHVTNSIRITQDFNITLMGNDTCDDYPVLLSNTTDYIFQHHTGILNVEIHFIKVQNIALVNSTSVLQGKINIKNVYYTHDHVVVRPMISIYHSQSMSITLSLDLRITNSTILQYYIYCSVNTPFSFKSEDSKFISSFLQLETSYNGNNEDLQSNVLMNNTTILHRDKAYMINFKGPFDAILIQNSKFTNTGSLNIISAKLFTMENSTLDGAYYQTKIALLSVKVSYMTNIFIDSITPTNAGGNYIQLFISHLIVNNITISNNNGSNSDVFIFSAMFSTLNIQSMVVSNNSQITCIHTMNSNVLIQNVLFIQNKDIEGININAGESLLRNITAENNSYSLKKVLISVMNGVFSINGFKVYNTSTSGEPHFEPLNAMFSNIDINGVEMKMNRGNMIGVNINKCNGTMFNIDFTENFIQKYLIVSSDTISITKLRILKNVLSGDFQAYFVIRHGFIEDVVISNNTGQSGINNTMFCLSLTNSRVKTERILFENNKGNIDGLVISNTVIVSNNITFRDNMVRRGVVVDTMSTFHHNVLVLDNDYYMAVAMVISDSNCVLTNITYKNVSSAGFGLQTIAANIEINNFVSQNTDIPGLFVFSESNAIMENIIVNNPKREVSAISFSQSKLKIKNGKFLFLKGDVLQMVEVNPNNYTGSSLEMSNTHIIGTTNSGILLAILASHFTIINNVTVEVLDDSFQKPLISLTALDSKFAESFIMKRTISISMTMKCPKNSYPTTELMRSLQSNYQYRCSQCGKGFYNIENTSANISYNSNHTVRHQINTTDIKCKVCPAGGICNNGIISNDNFWGYKPEINKITFIACPEGYSCNSRQEKCTSYDTCNYFRVGRLCGRCTPGYQVSYFTNRCIDSGDCMTKHYFWLCYLAFAFLYILVCTYIDTIRKIFQSIKRFLKSIFSFVRQKKKSKILSNNDNKHKHGHQCASTILICSGEKYQNLSAPTEEQKVGNENKHVSQPSGSFSTILGIVVSFYQIKYLFTVHLGKDYQDKKSLNNLIVSFFNLDAINVLPEKLCPYSKLNDFEKIFIKNFLFVIVMILCLLAVYLVFILISFIKRLGVYQYCYCHKDNSELEDNKLSTILTSSSLSSDIESSSVKKLPFQWRILFALIRVIIYSYTSLTMFTIKSINCKSINNLNVLYVYADVECYTWWQFMTLIFFITWIIFLPFSLHLQVQLLKQEYISGKEFMLLFLAPIFTPLYYRYRKRTFKSKSFVNNEKNFAEFHKELFEERYDEKETNTKVFIYWESWKLIQRLVVAIFAVFFVDPLYRLGCIVPIMIIFLVIHLYVKPYKSGFANILETALSASLCMLVSINLFRGFLYTYSLVNQGTIKTMLYIFGIFETILNPFTFIILIGAYQLTCGII